MSISGIICILLGIFLVEETSASFILGTPGVLKVTEVITTHDTIKLSWNKANGAARYYIRLDGEPRGFIWQVIKLVDLPQNQTSITFHDLKSETRYHVFVLSVGKNGRIGTYKGDVEVATLGASLPENPAVVRSLSLFSEKKAFKRDCTWTSWESDGNCKRDGKGKYRILRTRGKISAKNGGAECTGLSSKYEACTETSFVHSTFINAVATISVRPQTSDSGSSEQDCVEDFYDEQGVLRMVGQSCSNSRKKRESESFHGGSSETHLTKNKIDPKHKDVLFLLDESASVGPESFKIFMKLAKAITDNFCGNISVAKFKTRVGILSFDSVQHPRIDFKEFLDKKKLTLAMESSVKYSYNTSGWTCISEALKFARKQMFIKERGARLSDDVEKLIILMTDGCANCDEDNLAKEGKILEKEKIAVLVIQVGADEPCMESMKKLKTNNVCFHTFGFRNYSEVKDFTVKYDYDTLQGNCMDSWIMSTPGTCS